MGATWRGYTDIVKELVTAGANLNLQNNRGKSALMKAAYYGHTDTVKELVTAGANFNLQDNSGESALMEAAYYGYTDTVKELVTVGANLNMQNNDGDSAVIIATVKHRSGALQELVSAGADLNLQNEEGLTALMISARSGRTVLADILLTGDNIDIDIQENSTQWSALFFSAEREDVAMTLSLLKAGANALLKDKNGLTALEVAGATERSSHYSYPIKDLDGVCEVLRKHIREMTTATEHCPPSTTSTEEETTASDQDRSKETTASDQDRSTGRSHSQSTTSTQQETTTSDQDRSTKTTASDQDRSTKTTASDQDRSTETTARDQDTSAGRSRFQIVKNAGNWISELFKRLDERLKSADEKDQSEIKGQEIKGAQKMQKKRRGVNRRPDNQSHSTTVTVHVE